MALLGSVVHDFARLQRPPRSSASISDAPRIGLSWLVRLRWLAILGQLAVTALAVLVLRVSLPLLLVGSLIAVTALSNAALTFWLREREPSSRILCAILGLDVLLLTALLRSAGGASNPFSVFYLVHVALAALLLTPSRAWSIAALSSLSFGSLFVLPSHVIDPHMMHMQHGASSLHLQGMWFAYTLAAGVVVHFVSRVASALRAREQELFELQRSAARAEKLASLSTLAAGAAHELGTPLGTIALVAHELSRALQQRAGATDLERDAQLIRHEVGRCRDILQRMAANAGEGAGEMPSRVSVRGVESSLTNALGAAKGALAFEHTGEQSELVLPKRLLVEVLTNLVNNALDAQLEAGTDEPIRVVTRVDAEWAAFEISDHGVGIPESARARVGEPFFSTKAPGSGLGLGVFLARAFAEKVGGELEFFARAGGGTLARLSLPREMLLERGKQ